MRKSEEEQFSDRNDKEDARQSNAPCSTSWPSDGEGQSEVTAYHSALSKKYGKRRMPFDKHRMQCSGWVTTEEWEKRTGMFG